MAAGTTSSSPPTTTLSNHHSSAGGKAANGLSSNGMNSTNHYSPIHSTHPAHQHAQHPHHPAHGHPGQHYGGGPSGGLDVQGGIEDGDNRTRNAKAQRRHREKRKAHLKALEESVQVLTAQLEDARRQLGQAAYFSQAGNRPPNSPLSPSSKDLSQLQAENAYLRDENADLRRQLYTYRSNYGHPPPPPGDEIKSEQAGFAYPSAPGPPSPRRTRPVDGPAPDASGPSTADGPSSAASSSNSYPNHLDQYTPMAGNGERSRSRVMSSSSAPSASPYLHPDPRSVDTRYSSGQPVRYEAQPGMYSAPPAHQIPRYDVPSGGHHPYTARQDGAESVSWPPESGPPPFSSYPMGFSAHEGGSDEWRPEH